MTILKKMRSLLGRYGNQLQDRHVNIRSVFQGYKKILDDNNHALKIINDMSEKMSGGYLFDIAYIREAYSELATAMRDCLADFNRLTEGQYPQLEPVFNNIDSHIRELLNPQTKTARRRLISFDNILPESAKEVGGKNYHLSQVKNALGLAVPEGFVLTVHAYDDFIRYNHLDESITGLEDHEYDPGMLAEVRNRIMEGGFGSSLKSEVGEALGRLREECEGACHLAVRSSGEEEDEVFSFAGQFETVLNVFPDVDSVLDAYRRVIASLFSEEAIAYQLNLNYSPAGMRMAVGVIVMVDAVASGVVYTVNPMDKNQQSMLINSAWGLGTSVVDNLTEADTFIIRKKPPFETEEVRLGKKDTMMVMAAAGGLEKREVPADRQRLPSLNAEQLAELSRQALKIENFYHKPQDIEWALDRSGRVVILQSRHLRIQEPAGEDTTETVDAQPPGEHPVLMLDQGIVVYPGAVGGRAFIVDESAALADFPWGAILVARNDSPQFVRVMPYATAIITDSGNATSHMASVSREFRVPTVVNTGNATDVIKHGEDITLKADEDGGMVVYQGMDKEIIGRHHDSFIKLEELFEFRRKKYIMKFITPLNLVNPFTDEFVPERCRTIHDILRFIHEKSMQKLIDSSRFAGRQASLKRLDIPLLEDIHVIDIGGGLKPGTDKMVSMGQVKSAPLRAVIAGMAYPGAWRQNVGNVSLSDLMTASMRTGDIMGSVQVNLAVISRRYLNLAVRFGYHFTIVDAFVDTNPLNNHIYFRFLGGAAAVTKRVRRVHMLEIILRHFGFVTEINGDLITGVVTNVSEAEALRILDQVGRLMAYTRQLDAPLTSEAVADEYARRFINGDYTM